MNGRARVATVAVVLLIWSGGALFSYWASTWPRLRELDPSVPLIHIQPGYVDDLLSSIPWLFVVLAAGACLVIAMETVKYGLSATGQKLEYSLVLLLQGVLFVDVFRLSARDWWAFALILGGFTDYHRGRPDEAIPLAWINYPVPSLLLVIALATVLLVKKNSRHSAAAQHA